MAGKKLEQDFVTLRQRVLRAKSSTSWRSSTAHAGGSMPTASVPLPATAEPGGVYTITIPGREADLADCMELRVKRNIQAGKTIKVTIKSWHPKKKKVFSYTSNVEGKSAARWNSYHIPGLLQDHVTKHAKSRAADKARHEFT
jgi:hypothetical protein